MTPIDISIEGITHLTDNLKLSTTSGINNINSKILKNTVSVSSKILFYIFQHSLNTGLIPADWKIAKVIPIFKNGDKNIVGNYRPISLTCICCEMMEHIIASHVYRHLESNNFLAKQHGFRRGLSCETQLLELTTHLHSYMDSNIQIDYIFLDFSKAFDRVAHCPLFIKLSEIKLDLLTLSWLRERER